MTPSFSVESIIVCDYAAAMEQGKHVLAGVYGNEIRFETAPGILPPFHYFIIVRPHLLSGRVLTRLIAPSGNELFSADTTFTYTSPPPSFATLNFLFQVPPMQFPGLGEYRLEVTDGEAIVGSRQLNFSVGKTIPSLEVSLSGTLTVHAALVAQPGPDTPPS